MELISILQKITNQDLTLKDGENLICCPLHKENKPSFSFKTNGDKQYWNCFSCNVGGNEWELIKQYLKSINRPCEFKDALDWAISQDLCSADYTYPEKNRFQDYWDIMNMEEDFASEVKLLLPFIELISETNIKDHLGWVKEERKLDLLRILPTLRSSGVFVITKDKILDSKNPQYNQYLDKRYDIGSLLIPISPLNTRKITGLQVLKSKKLTGFDKMLVKHSVKSNGECFSLKYKGEHKNNLKYNNANTIIVEGVYDAMALFEVGFNAIATIDLGNQEKFVMNNIKYLYEKATIFQDFGSGAERDSAIKCSNWLNTRSFCSNNPDLKDANAMLEDGSLYNFVAHVNNESFLENLIKNLIAKKKLHIFKTNEDRTTGYVICTHNRKITNFKGVTYKIMIDKLYEYLLEFGYYPLKDGKIDMMEKLCVILSKIDIPVFQGQTFDPELEYLDLIKKGDDRFVELLNVFEPTHLHKKYKNTNHSTSKENVDKYWDNLKQDLDILFPVPSRLIRHATGYDEDAYKWFINWLAYKSQNLKDENTNILVFYGEQGSGKTSIPNLISCIFGSYVNQTADFSALDKGFTDGFENKLFISLQDNSNFSQKQLDRIKNLTGNSKFAHNSKGVKCIEDFPFYSSFLIGTNNPNFIKIESSNRRISMFTMPTFAEVEDFQNTGISGKDWADRWLSKLAKISKSDSLNELNKDKDVDLVTLRKQIDEFAKFIFNLPCYKPNVFITEVAKAVEEISKPNYELNLESIVNDGMENFLEENNLTSAYPEGSVENYWVRHEGGYKISMDLINKLININSNNNKYTEPVKLDKTHHIRFRNKGYYTYEAQKYRTNIKGINFRYIILNCKKGG